MIEQLAVIITPLGWVLIFGVVACVAAFIEEKFDKRTNNEHQ